MLESDWGCRINDYLIFVRKIVARTTLFGDFYATGSPKVAWMDGMIGVCL
jgi:hypothetical protein